MRILETRYGPISVVGPVEWRPHGGVKSCTPGAETTLRTSLGDLVPQFTADDARRGDVAPLTFHENGTLRSLALERQTAVATPVGPIPAELVILHPNGTPHRVFPLNGKLSGYWTEADEAGLAEPLRVETPCGPVTARILGLRFDPRGALLGLTLWPGEAATVATPVGPIAARIGLAWRPDGTLRSLEPARPTPIPTPFGPIMAYDPDAVGVSGDVNSLEFSPAGGVEGLVTVQTALTAVSADGSQREWRPGVRESLCGDEASEPEPLGVAFTADRIRFRLGRETDEARLADAKFSARPIPRGLAVLSPARCGL